MKKKNIIGFLFTGFTTALLAFTSLYLAKPFHFFTGADVIGYSLILSEHHNHLTTSREPIYGCNETITALGNYVPFEFDCVSYSDNVWQKIESGGYFFNFDPISGMSSIEIIFSNYDEEIDLMWSLNDYDDFENCQTISSDINLSSSFDFNDDRPNYFKILAKTDVYIMSVVITFQCIDYYTHQSSHEVIHYDAVAPTCEEPGHNAYDVCTVCGYSTYVEIEPLGHDYEEIVDVESTNEHVGRKHEECSRCHKIRNYTVQRRTGISYIEISTFDDFFQIPANTTNNYILINDIDFSGKTWTPITFKGIFDGAYHYITNTSKPLFSDNYGTIENLHITNTSTLVAQGSFANWNHGTIDMCCYEGNISYEYNSYVAVGGLIGTNVGTITNSYFNGNVDGLSTSTGGSSCGAGGIAGKNSDVSSPNTAIIKHCYAHGNINGKGTGGSGYAGGIVGYNYYDFKEANHCYFSGSVNAETKDTSSSYHAGAGAIVGGYEFCAYCYYYDGTLVTVTYGSVKVCGVKMTDYDLMVSTAIGDSDLYNYCPRTSMGDPYIPSPSDSGNSSVSLISLSNYELTLALNETKTITGTIIPSSAGSPDDLIWESSNPAVASVNGGVITALSYGNATITASYDGVSASCEVQVLETIHVESIVITSSVTFNKTGIGQQLSVTVYPSNATNKSVVWSTSNSSVATVSSSGYVTAVAPGNATITARSVDGNKTSTCSITVNGEQLSISLTSTTVRLKVGQSTSIGASLSPYTVTGKTVLWASTNTSIATVSGTMITNNISNGTITGVSVGTTTIIAVVGVNISASCTVIVSN